MIHLAKTEASATGNAASGGPTKDQIQGVRTVVGVDQSRSTITLADARNHIETLNVPDRSMLRTVKPGDNVDVTYTEAIDISLEPA